MSVVGSNCLILTGGQLRPAIIRAASQPLFRNSDFSQIRVLLEWCEGECQREWVDLSSSQAVYLEHNLLWARRVEQQRAVAWPAKSYTLLCGSIPHNPDTVIVEYFCDQEKAQLYYNETKELQLLEAKETLSQHHQMLHELEEWEESLRSRELLSGSMPLSGKRVSVCNVQHTNNWICGQVTSHNLQTKELTLVEDRTQASHTVSPLMVHVVVHPTAEEGQHEAPHLHHRWHHPSPLTLTSSPEQQQQQLGGSTDSLHITSPHHASPVLQEVQSPRFNLTAGCKSTVHRSPSMDLPTLPHRARRSSLQPMSLSMMRSEPNLPRRCSLDPLAVQQFSGTFDFLRDAQALGRSPLHPCSSNGSLRHSSPHGSLTQLNASPHGSLTQLNASPHGSLTQLNASPHGSSTQLNNAGGGMLQSPHGSNTQLNIVESNSITNNDSHFPSFSSTDIFNYQERSKSMDNITAFSTLQHPPPPTNTSANGPPTTPSAVATASPGGPLHSRKRRCSFGPVTGGRPIVKKPRFEMLPTIMDPQDSALHSGTKMGPPNKSLARSVSQPAIFPGKFDKKNLLSMKIIHKKSQAESSGTDSTRHEDDLDIIKQIIDKDQLTDASADVENTAIHSRSLSLSHIPRSIDFSNDIGSMSLPTLHHVESMCVLHTNYNSAPDCSQLGSPPTYESTLQKPPPATHVAATLSNTSCHSSLSDLQSIDQIGNQNATPTFKRRGSNFEGSTSLPTPGFCNSAQNTPGCDMQPQSSPAFEFADIRTTSLQQQPQQNLTASEGGGFNSPPAAFEFMNTSSATNYSSSSNDSAKMIVSDRLSFSEQENSKNISDIMTSFKVSDSSQSVSNDILTQHLQREQSQISSSNDPLSSYLGESTVSPPHCAHHHSAVPTPSHTSAAPRDVIGNPNSNKGSLHSAQVASEAEILSPMSEKSDVKRLDTIQELSIAKIVNQHSHEDDGCDIPEHEDLRQGAGSSPLGCSSTGSSIHGGESKPKKTKTKVNSQKEKSGHGKRGRPRLTEEEKMRRKELRELGLMKRSKRRTKEEVAQWKAEKILSPAKRGRKPGSGKKNIVRAATGKEVFICLDMARYPNGSILLQNGFCRAFPGVPKCLECSTCEGDLPITRYCRFLEFRKLRIIDNATPVITVEGFADYTDVSAQDLVPWTPLKAGYGGMDEATALFALRKTLPYFISIITEQARTLPDENVIPAWKRAVKGIREMCDTCDTTLFNFHWVCQQCGFCICPKCYHLAYESEEGVEAVSSMQASVWPSCVHSTQPHRPAGLKLAQIIPANVLGDVVLQVLKICDARKIQISVPPVIQRLVAGLSKQEPQSCYQNDFKKSRGASTSSGSGSGSSSLGGSGVGSGGSSTAKNRIAQLQQFPPQLLGPPEPASHQHYHQPAVVGATMAHEHPLPPSSLELPHSSRGGAEDHPAPPIPAPHTWLCDSTLLCLLDPVNEKNMAAFQARWNRGEPVVIMGVHNLLNSELWTPQSFERDFGDELADLVDCRMGIALLQLPSRTFWAGFENINVRLRDPTSDEPRLLKLKDWPPTDDFSEKLPKRFVDIMNALPLQHYTSRDGKLNMTSSLPDFFVKPDLGPKMYNAYGSAVNPKCGTTNLHVDISDAVNVMVYSAIPPSVEEEERQLIEQTVARECCQQTVRRVRDSSTQVGAIWHIYSTSDADKIRAFLRKVFEERGMHEALGSDPIHDQLVYMDEELRLRLHNEYGVKGWTIAQCVGDAIFIPAGAPHQVRNLSSCVKIAEDFVSPEHVYECLKLTEEFRHLSERHINHEDKLQVKNIIYHSVKDIVGVLRSTTK